MKEPKLLSNLLLGNFYFFIISFLVDKSVLFYDISHLLKQERISIFVIQKNH